VATPLSRCAISATWWSVLFMLRRRLYAHILVVYDVQRADCIQSSMSLSIHRPLSHSVQYVVGSFACIGGGLFGLDISSMSGVLNVCGPFGLNISRALTIKSIFRTSIT